MLRVGLWISYGISILVLTLIDKIKYKKYKLEDREYKCGNKIRKMLIKCVG